MQAHVLADGRLHLHHGPIDMICQVWGAGRAAAFDRAVARFDGLLEELVAELPALRTEAAEVSGPVARVMASATSAFRPAFITPMAAVAGAVAEAVLAAMVAGPGVTRAYANNGGDIALYLTPGTRLDCAMAQGGSVQVTSDMVARGIATSGWRGRSWSLGIADAVTVVARTAAMADAAATMIANAVDLPGHSAITRRAAVDLQADSDLGHRRVTVAVGLLSQAEARFALARGVAAARGFRARGLIEGAALFLQGEVVSEGSLRLEARAHV